MTDIPPHLRRFLPETAGPTSAERFDAYRRQEPGVPNRSEAIRILVGEALDARERKPKDKPDAG